MSSGGPNIGWGEDTTQQQGNGPGQMELNGTTQTGAGTSPSICHQSNAWSTGHPMDSPMTNVKTSSSKILINVVYV